VIPPSVSPGYVKIYVLLRPGMFTFLEYINLFLVGHLFNVFIMYLIILSINKTLFYSTVAGIIGNGDCNTFFIGDFSPNKKKK
jgi:hypothetical protein